MLVISRDATRRTAHYPCAQKLPLPGPHQVRARERKQTPNPNSRPATRGRQSPWYVPQPLSNAAPSRLPNHGEQEQTERTEKVVFLLPLHQSNIKHHKSNIPQTFAVTARSSLTAYKNIHKSNITLQRSLSALRDSVVNKITSVVPVVPSWLIPTPRHPTSDAVASRLHSNTKHVHSS